mgnify:CR=1 FL=1
MNARAELQAIIARLETMSHVPAVNLDPTPAATTDSKGGARPRGGIDRKDDREPDFALKSADHYRRRLARAHTEGIVLVILRDAQRTLRAYTHTPVADGADPKPGDPLFMRWLAKQQGRVEDISYRTGVSRALVYKARDTYGEKAA